MAIKKNPYIVEGGLEVREGVIKAPAGSSALRPVPTGPGEIRTNTSTGHTELSTGVTNPEFRSIEYQYSWVGVSQDITVPVKTRAAYAVNTTNGPIRMKLPISPLDKQTIIIVDVKGTFKVNNLTIDTNGRPFQGKVEDYVCRDDWSSIEIYYIDAVSGWAIRYGKDILTDFQLGAAAIRDVGLNASTPTKLADLMEVGAFGIGGGVDKAQTIDVLWPSNDLNAVNRTGIYTATGSANAPLNDAAGIVLHMHRNSAAGIAAYQQYVGASGVYHRTFVAGNWGSWRVSSGGLFTIDSVSLNTVVDAGNYFAAATVTDAPINGGAGYLSVLANGNNVFQRFVSAAGNRMKEYTRKFVGGRWSAWVRTVNDDYVEYLPKARPSLRLNFINSALDSRFTFARASRGTYVGADGLIYTANNNEVRYQHDPITGERQGVLIEGARTQLLSNSFNVTTPNNQGVTTAFTGTKLIVDGNPQTFVGNVSGPVSGNLGITPATTPTLSGGRSTASVFVRKIHADVKGFVLYVPSYATGDNQAIYGYFDLTDMSFRQTGTGLASFTFKKYRHDWYRVGISWTSLSGPMANVFTLYPFNKDAQGNPVLMDLGNYRGVEVFAWDVLQVENGEGASSPIITTNAVGPRAVDLLSIDVDARVIGPNGTISFSGVDMGHNDGASRLYRFTDGTTLNSVYASKVSAGPTSGYTSSANIVAGGINSTLNLPAKFTPKLNQVITWGNIEGNFGAANGLSANFSGNPRNPTTINKLWIGSDGTGNAFYGAVSSISVYPANYNRDIVENTSEV